MQVQSECHAEENIFFSLSFSFYLSVHMKDNLFWTYTNIDIIYANKRRGVLFSIVSQRNYG